MDCPANKIAVAASAGGAAIPRLLQLLGNHSSSDDARAAATSVVRTLAADITANHQQIIAAGVVQCLIDMISDRSSMGSRVTAEAAGTWMMLSMNPNLRDSTGKAIKPLLSLMDSCDCDNDADVSFSGFTLLQECTGALMYVVKEHAANQAACIAAGGTAVLVKLLKNSTDEGVIMYAAGALDNLAFGAPAAGYVAVYADTSGAGVGIRTAIADAGAIPLLVALLSRGSSGDSSSSPAIMQKVAGTLWNLAHEHSPNRKAIAEAGAIPHLLRLLSHGSSSPAAAAAAAHVAAVDAAAAAAFAAGNAECGTNDVYELIQDAAGALATLAENQPENQQAIADAAGIQTLVQLLFIPDSSSNSSTGASSRSSSSSKHFMHIQEEAARALAAVAATQSEAVVAACAIPHLVKLLEFDNSTGAGVTAPHKVQLQAVRALAAVAAGQPKHQERVAAEPNALKKLNLLAQHSGDLQVQAATAAVVTDLKRHPKIACKMLGSIKSEAQR